MSRSGKKENDVKPFLKSMGYYPVRSAGSGGIWDIVGISKDDVKLIQVKSTESDKGVHSIVTNEELLDMIDFETTFDKELWIWRSIENTWYIYAVDGDGLYQKAKGYRKGGKDVVETKQKGKILI